LNGKKLTKGFTLVELLVVVALIGILSAIGIPAYNGYINSAKTNSAQNSLRLIYLAEVEQFSDNSQYYETTSGSCGEDSHHANQLISIFLVAQKQFHKKASLIFIFVLNQVIPLQSTKLLPIRSAVTIGFQ